MIDPRAGSRWTSLSFIKGLPRLALDQQGHEKHGRRGYPRRVLLCCPLLATARHALEHRGVVFTTAIDAQAAMVALGERDFDLVVVDVEQGGLELVHAVKLGAPSIEVPASVRADAMRRHPVTPMVVMPLDGGTEYAVIVHPPEIAFLEDGSNIPLEDAIARLDGKKLLRGRYLLG